MTPDERIAKALESIASSMNAFLFLGYGAYFVWLIRGCAP